MTAWCCLFGDGPIAGQTVLVTGGAGAVGHYAVQLAKWGGARVIATVSSAPRPSRRGSPAPISSINYRTEDVAAKGTGLYRAARRRSRRRRRFRRQYRNHAETDGDEFDHRGLCHQRQSQSGRADARVDGKMHRAAHAGAVRAAAGAVGGGASRYLEMARGRAAHAQHRRPVRAVGHRAGAPRGRERRQARHRHRRLRS